MVANIGFACPRCGTVDDDRVVESRKTGYGIRRRRQCNNPQCRAFFRTTEQVKQDLSVLKNRGHLEEYRREKLKESLNLAFKKVPGISDLEKEALCNRVEDRILPRVKDGVIPSGDIALIVVDELQKKSKFFEGYIRFIVAYLPRREEDRPKFIDWVNGTRKQFAYLIDKVKVSEPSSEMIDVGDAE